MNIIIENKYYDFDLAKYLPKEYCKLSNGRSKTSYVGYYSFSGKVIFILPKGFEAYEYLDFDDNKKTLNVNLSWPLTIFKTLKKYVKKNSSSIKIERVKINEIATNVSNIEHSIIDTMFSLIALHKNNPFIFFKELEFTKKNKSRQSWKKTLSKSIPIIDDNSIVYLNSINHNSQQVYDNQLLVIYYSTLYEISKNLSINLDLNEQLPILKNHQMTLLKKNALKVLKNIKGKYFSDLHKKIHFFLVQYYSIIGQNSKKTIGQEYLLSSNFELIFEDMVDEVISDVKAMKLFKNHKDGKILDHIYYDKSILSELKDYNSFYIGDSKYYSNWKDLINSKEPIYKQYTYSMNVINQCTGSNLENKTGIKVKEFLKENKILVCDRVNHSYHPIINFFILPDDNENEYLINILNNDNGKYVFNYSYHFKERAFDRNTNLIVYFKINIKKLINLYLGNGDLIKERSIAREYIRNKSIKVYKQLYKFKKISKIEKNKIECKDGIVFSNKYVHIKSKLN